MQGVTHMAGGAAAVMAYMTVAQMEVTPPLLIAMAGVGVVGSLFPDIDQPGSKISNKLPVVNKAVQAFTSHRGVFHAPALYAALLALWLWKGPAEWLALGNAFLLGAASHLFLDMFNYKGIPLLFPLSKKKTHLAKVKLGSRWETAIRVCLSLAAVGLFGAMIFCMISA